MNTIDDRNGVLENLERHVGMLLLESKDHYYTEYLQKLLERVRQQKYQTDLLAAELDRSYEMYVNRMKLAGVEVDKAQKSAKVQEPVKMQEQAPGEAQETEELVEQQGTVEPQGTVEQQGTIEPQEPVEPQGTLKLQEPIELQKPIEPQELIESLELTEAQKSVEVQETMELQSSVENQIQEAVEKGLSTEAPDTVEAPKQADVQPFSVPVPEERKAAPQKQSSTEFTIGAAVLSIIGGGFILAALVTLGMTFAGGIVKGACLYGVALFFLLISELLLYRKLPMLGAAFSAIGIGGLYLVTIVNYLRLHNFNLLVMLGVTLGITLFVVLLSRKRDSVLYRIIAMIAGYLCFLTIERGITDTEFLVVSGMILLMNILCIAFPVRRHYAAIRMVHMFSNSFFAIFFVCRALLVCDVSKLPVLIFVISSMLILQILFVVQRYSYHKEKVKEQYCFLAVYYFSAVCYLFMVTMLAGGLVDIYGDNWYCYGSAIAVAVISLLSMLALTLKKCSGQEHIYTILNLILLCVMKASGEKWDDIICLLILLVAVKAIGWWKNSVILRVNDLCITVLLCFAVATHEGAQAYALLAGIVLSILLMHYWQTCFEIILTATLAAYTASHLPTILQLPMIVGLLLIGILVFNNVKRWRGKHILLFNGLALGGQLICFLDLHSPVYQNEYITYFCMLVFGLATIGLTLQEKYQMNFKGKYMVLAIFLTYMAFIFRTNVPVVNSILLMIIALVCVGTGFVVGKKTMRIYGLILSLVVCGKLVMYDFFKAATLQKTILFFTVGVIALVIAAIYIILEKKNNK